jgi:hypothetical protein
MIKRRLAGAEEGENATGVAVQRQHTTLFYTISSNEVARYSSIEEPVCN